MIIDHTQLIRGFQSAQPISFLKRRGLAAAFVDDRNGWSDRAYGRGGMDGLGYSEDDRTGWSAGTFPRGGMDGYNRSGFQPRMLFAGLGDVTADAVGTGATPDIWTKLNSEIVFLNNLVRVNRGQSQLPLSASAPTVNVGVNAETKKFVAIGIGVLALVFLARKR